MVQKSSDSRRGRGRPPQFDRDAVLDAALATFWARGVEHTTLADLEEATGTVRTTLYNSFDGKAGLHRAAAERYVELAEQTLFGPLFDGTAGVADVVAFLDALRAEIESGANPPGCFIVNDLTSPQRDEAGSSRYLTSLERGLGNALGRAVDLGELEPDAAEPLAGSLLASVIGINVVNRHAGPEAAMRLIADVKATLASASAGADRG